MVESYPFLRLLPPVTAIVLAIVLKDVNIALLVAAVSGCLLLTEFRLFEAVETISELFVEQVADTDHASVTLFTVLLGSMICIMGDSGGTDAVVSRVARFADTRKKGQSLTWLAGLIVFFDDYANTMLIGGSVRPLTDRLKISRAKLAFLIDATAAPVAGLALSTWTAFEIEQVQLGLEEASVAADATAVFVSTIPYRIYPILAIFVVGAVAVSGRDFGPMLKAEREVAGAQTAPSSDQQGESVQPAGGTIWTAIIPIVMLVITVVGLLIRDYLLLGEGWWQNVDAYQLLLTTSLFAATAAAFSALAFGRLSISECSQSAVKGIANMIPAVVVLILAWAINAVCSADQLNTAGYIVSLVGDSVRAEFLPAIAFIAAGAMAVSVGSSFTTMGLMIPMFIPLAAAMIDGDSGILISSSPVFLATVGAILAGAIFGDHCSPISDTTVLSSAAAGCDHLQHVATQVPYAIVTAAVSLLFGYLPIGFGCPWWIALPLSTVAAIGIVCFLGEATEDSAAVDG